MDHSYLYWIASIYEITMDSNYTVGGTYCRHNHMGSHKLCVGFFSYPSKGFFSLHYDFMILFTRSALDHVNRLCKTVLPSSNTPGCGSTTV